MDSNKAYKILSLDGGGSWALIQARVPTLVLVCNEDAPVRRLQRQ